MLRVLKFGGSSVATTSKIMDIAKHLKTFKEKGDSLVVVVSAMGKTTNNLIELSKEIDKNPIKSEMDNLLSTGEIVSTALLSIALNKLGVKAISFSGARAGIVTTNHFNNAFIESVNPSQIYKYLKKDYIVIVAGFQGVTKDDMITTLGRGGSDTTAVALASALKCVCEIYTDVDGVYTVDPRVYPLAKKLDEITYDEMMEMSVNGAKVLETRSVELAKKYNVELYLGKTLETEKRGTFVMSKIENFEKMKISGLSVKDNISYVCINLKDGNLCDFAQSVSDIVDKLEMVNVLSTSNDKCLSFVLPDEKVNDVVLKIYGDLNGYKFKVNAQQNFTKLTLVGNGLSTHKYFMTKTLSLLNNACIKIEGLSLNEISMSILISSEHKVKAIEILSKEFGL